MSKDPFAKMPDADLAKLVRRTMAMLGDTKDQKGLKRIAGTSAALFLIGSAVSQNGATLTVSLGGATDHGEDVGDWIVTVDRQGADQNRNLLSEADVILAGTLRPDCVDEAIACFERLTVCQLRAKE